jgi:hypothetical protein
MHLVASLRTCAVFKISLPNPPGCWTFDPKQRYQRHVPLSSTPEISSKHPTLSKFFLHCSLLSGLKLFKVPSSLNNVFKMTSVSILVEIFHNDQNFMQTQFLT